MEDNILVFLAVFCSKCDNILDVLSNREELLYIDKVCECGSIGFYTQTIKVKVIVEKPFGEKPFLEWDGHNFYDGSGDDIE